MRTLTPILFSALLSALFTMLMLLATPGQAMAERYFTQGRDYNHPPVDRPRADRPRAGHPRADRPRADRPRAYRPRAGRPHADRPRTDRQRYGDYHHRSPYPRYAYPRYTPRHRHHGSHWYSYPRHHYYPRHYLHYHGDDFLGWLAFIAITLTIIDNLNEQQQREHELAMREALLAPVGETIIWEDNNASGSVTTIREGTSSLGRYCREYTQDVRIGNESQQAYGTACRNPDGSWEIMQ